VLHQPYGGHSSKFKYSAAQIKQVLTIGFTGCMFTRADTNGMLRQISFLPEVDANFSRNLLSYHNLMRKTSAFVIATFWNSFWMFKGHYCDKGISLGSHLMCSCHRNIKKNVETAIYEHCLFLITRSNNIKNNKMTC